MSIVQTLRHVDVAEYRRAEWVRAWQRRGQPASLRHVRCADSLICVTGGGGDATWVALLRPRDWLEHVFPNLECLLPRGCEDQDILRLFRVARHPLFGDFPMLRHAGTHDARLVKGSFADGSLQPCIDMPFGPLWLPEGPMPPALSAEEAYWVRSWPLTLVFVLGTSRLSTAAIATLAVGDVLVISLRNAQVMTAGRCIGSFSITGSDLEVNVTLDEQHGESSPVERPDAPALALKGLPLELRFVLQDAVVTLAELAALAQGQVIPLDTGCERSIRVFANGQLVAEGELVRWEECLGVELHTVHRGAAT